MATPSPKLTQENRKLVIRVDGDELPGVVLQQVDFKESVSHLPAYNLKLISERNILKYDTLFNKQIEIEILHGEDQNSSGRVIQGYINQFKQVDSDVSSGSGYFSCNVSMVPWLWFLSINSQNRTFEDKTVKEVIEAVFADYQKLGSPKFNLKTDIVTSVKVPLIVQYNETDFNFVSRIMEQYGIFYTTSPELVIADNVNAYKENKDLPENMQRSYLSLWSETSNIVPQRLSILDHDYAKSTTKLTAFKSITDNNIQKEGDLNLYGLGVREKNQGDVFVDMELDRRKVDAITIQTQSIQYETLPLSAGQKFKMMDFKNSYFVKEVTVHARDYVDMGVKIDDVDQTAAFNMQFELLPAEQRYVPPLTKVPYDFSITHEAIVVDGNRDASKISNEYHTDEYGRVLVQTFWDDNAFWARPLYTGLNAGVFRTGTKVLVKIEPHGAIIVGQIDDDKQKPLYNLDSTARPENQPISGLRARPGAVGKKDQYNEIKLNDDAKPDNAGIFTTVPVGNYELHVNKKHIIHKAEEGDVTIEAPKGTLTLKNDNCSFTMKPDGAIEIQGKSLDVNIEENFKTGVGKNYVVLSEDASLRTDDSIEISSKGDSLYEAENLTTKAKAGYEVSAGLNAEIVANGNAKLEGRGGKGTLKGPKVNISGAGSQVNKAPMINSSS